MRWLLLLPLAACTPHVEKCLPLGCAQGGGDGLALLARDNVPSRPDPAPAPSPKPPAPEPKPEPPKPEQKPDHDDDDEHEDDDDHDDDKRDKKRGHDDD